MIRLFEEEYFVNSKVSNYKDYFKRKFDQQVQDLIQIVPVKPDMKILDFGCAAGGLLSEFKNRGFSQLKGTDISRYAIDYGKENFCLSEELDYYNLKLLEEYHDVIFLLDVLEHMTSVKLLKHILKIANAPVIVVRIPVTAVEGELFVLEVSNNDATHFQCHTKEWWIRLFEEQGYIFDKLIEGRSIYNSEGVLSAVFTKHEVE